MKPKPARSLSVISSSPSITDLTQPPSMRSTGAPPVSSTVSESVQIPTSSSGTSEILEPPSKKAKYADLFSEFVQFMEHRELFLLALVLNLLTRFRSTLRLCLTANTRFAPFCLLRFTVKSPRLLPSPRWFPPPPPSCELNPRFTGSGALPSRSCSSAGREGNQVLIPPPPPPS